MIVSGAIGVALSQTAWSAESNYNEIAKQLNVMNDIFVSSFSENNDEKTARISKVRSFYLHGQGIIFEISASSSRNTWRGYRYYDTMPSVAPVAPIAPVPPLPPMADSYFGSELDVQIADAMALSEDIVMGMQEEYVEQGRERLHQAQESLRNAAFEIRDKEHDIRNAQYQLRTAEGEEKSALTKEIKALEAEKEKLTQQQKQASAELAEITKKRQQQQEEYEKNRQTFYANLEISLSNTLCTYSKGLRALPNKQYVSIIIKSGGDKEQRGNKDRVMVFTKDDINACANDKISTENLYQKAEKYQF